MKELYYKIRRQLLIWLSKIDSNGVQPYTYQEGNITYIGITYRNLIKLREGDEDLLKLINYEIYK